MVDDYVSVCGSYKFLSSGAAPANDFCDHAHMLFQLVEQLLKQLGRIEEWLQKVRFGRAESLWHGEATAEKDCPNAEKARKRGKGEKLNRARSAMGLMEMVMGEGSFTERAWRFLAKPIVLLTSAKGAKLLTPQQREYALF
jgi:hypothetical protein